MDTKQKELELRNLAQSVIKNPKYQNEIKHILSALNITEEQIIRAYLDYDMDVTAYQNEIYEPLAIRVVLHLHNLLQGSWHQQRQDTILEFVREANPKTAVDVGFGVPTKYIREFILKTKSTKLTLVDLYQSALQFSHILLDYIDKNWEEAITLKKHDMNKNEFVGEFETYIFQDSIEHTKNPAHYLTNTVNLAPKNATFILSIPVGPIVPAHYISWKNEKEVKKWLKKCGLEITSQKKVYPNPEIDLFSIELEEKFYNLIVKCKKT